MNALKEDMLALKVVAFFSVAMIFVALYCANYLAFECIRIKPDGESIVQLIMCLSAFLGAIVACLFLIWRINESYMDVYIEHSKKMFSGASHVFTFWVCLASAFLMTHLVNIFGGWKFGDWRTGTLSAGDVLIFSLLFSLIATVVSFLLCRPSKKGRK